MHLGRNDELTVGTALLVLSTAVLAVNGNLYQGALAQYQPYSFWTAPLAWVAYGLFALAVVVFGLAFKGVPFPWWSKPVFPTLSILIDSEGTQKRPPDETDQSLWRWFSIRVTNREPERTASLAIRFAAKLAHPEFDGRLGETAFVDPKGSPPSGFPEGREWNQVVNLPPHHSADGTYAVKLTQYWLVTLAQPVQASLMIEDLISGRAVVIPARTGTFPKMGWAEPHRDVAGGWEVYAPDPEPDDS